MAEATRQKPRVRGTTKARTWVGGIVEVRARRLEVVRPEANGCCDAQCCLRKALERDPQGVRERAGYHTRPGIAYFPGSHFARE